MCQLLPNVPDDGTGRIRQTAKLEPEPGAAVFRPSHTGQGVLVDERQNFLFQRFFLHGRHFFARLFPEHPFQQKVHQAAVFQRPQFRWATLSGVHAKTTEVLEPAQVIGFNLSGGKTAVCKQLPGLGLLPEHHGRLARCPFQRFQTAFVPVFFLKQRPQGSVQGILCRPLSGKEGKGRFRGVGFLLRRQGTGVLHRQSRKQGLQLLHDFRGGTALLAGGGMPADVQLFRGAGHGLIRQKLLFQRLAFQGIAEGQPQLNEGFPLFLTENAAGGRGLGEFTQHGAQEEHHFRVHGAHPVGGSDGDFVHLLGNIGNLFRLHHQPKELGVPLRVQLSAGEHQRRLIQNVHEHIPQPELMGGGFPLSRFFQLPAQIRQGFL